MNRKGIAPILIILVIAVALALGSGALYYAMQSSATKPVACTQEAKQCLDGSYVSRTGPNCEFAACPTATSKQNATVTPPAATTTTVVGSPGKEVQTDGGAQTRLTSYSWTFTHSGAATSEGYRFIFSKDGTFTWNVISDYSEVGHGLWSFRASSKDEGFLFLLWQRDSSSSLPDGRPRRDVLHYEFLSGNRLRLAGDALDPMTLPSGFDTRIAQVKTADIVNPQNFPDYFQMTSQMWEKENTGDDTFIPDSYKFEPEGTFVAGYRHGQCQHGGHWSLQSGMLILEMAPDHCDQRGYNSAIRWGQSYVFESGMLILNSQYKYGAHL